MAKPSPRLSASFLSAADNSDDGRLSTPTFRRNNPPMVAELAPWLRNRAGPVLEFGSGSGEHAAAFALAFRTLDWWPSDPDPAHRASVAGWQRALKAPERVALDLDASADWPADPAVAALGPLSAVLSMNVIHIAPIAVAQGLVAGAGRALGPKGLLILYGPFKENGRHTGEGNVAFDQRLRAENPDWGIRDAEEITRMARSARLEPAARIEMPANNRLMIFAKS